MDLFMEPFESIGITPPRGRQGHSVPTPRPLAGLAAGVAYKMEEEEVSLLFVWLVTVTRRFVASPAPRVHVTGP